MSCYFMPCKLVRQFHVRQFHVRHFQCPQLSTSRLDDYLLTFTWAKLRKLANVIFVIAKLRTKQQQNTQYDAIQ